MAYKFVGDENSGWLSGIPRKDLTNEEVRDLGPDMVAEIEASPLYQRVAENKLPDLKLAAHPPIIAEKAGTE